MEEMERGGENDLRRWWGMGSVEYITSRKRTVRFATGAIKK